MLYLYLKVFIEKNIYVSCFKGRDYIDSIRSFTLIQN